MTDPPPLPPATQNSERVRLAYQRRHESDYIFDYWTALLWTALTCGIFGLYVVYQMIRRMRDHNRRRLELLDASIAFAWEQARSQGVGDELRPAFERMAANTASLRDMTSDFREPVVWTLLHLIGGIVTDVVALILLDGDLVKHDYTEGAVEADLAAVYTRLGRPVPAPDPARVKAKHNYAARVAATIFTFGMYMFWWFYNAFDEPNRHFQTNWAWEDALAGAVYSLSQ